MRFLLLLEGVIIDFPDLKIMMMQMAWPANIGRPINLIFKADYLSTDDKRAILWGNAVDLLGIKEQNFKSMF